MTAPQQESRDARLEARMFPVASAFCAVFASLSVALLVVAWVRGWMG